MIRAESTVPMHNEITCKLYIASWAITIQLHGQKDTAKMVIKQGSSNSGHMQATHDSNIMDMAKLSIKKHRQQNSLAEFWTNHLNYWNLNYRPASITWSMSYRKMAFLLPTADFSGTAQKMEQQFMSYWVIIQPYCQCYENSLVAYL